MAKMLRKIPLEEAKFVICNLIFLIFFYKILKKKSVNYYPSVFEVIFKISEC